MKRLKVNGLTKPLDRYQVWSWLITAFKIIFFFAFNLPTTTQPLQRVSFSIKFQIASFPCVEHNTICFHSAFSTFAYSGQPRWSCNRAVPATKVNDSRVTNFFPYIILDSLIERISLQLPKNGSAPFVPREHQKKASTVQNAINVSLSSTTIADSSTTALVERTTSFSSSALLHLKSIS